MVKPEKRDVQIRRITRSKKKAEDIAKEHTRKTRDSPPRRTDESSKDTTKPGETYRSKDDTKSVQTCTTEDLRKLQEAEDWYPTIHDVIRKRLSGKDVNFMAMSAMEKTLFGMRQQLFMKDGIMYRRWKTTLGAERVQLIVPTGARRELFDMMHSENTDGDFGVRKTLVKIRRKYFWPAMGTDPR